MSLYTPEVVTLWVFHSESTQTVESLFEFSYSEEGTPERSPFARAYRLDWYDDDFAELMTGGPARDLLNSAATSWRTLDEQTASRLPDGDWNGIYLIYGQAGEAWQLPERRPAMHHGAVEIDGVTFRLVDTFHVLIRP